MFFFFLSGAFSAFAVWVVDHVATNVGRLTDKFRYLPAIIIASINVLSPLVFRFCVHFERWLDPLTRSYNRIAREFLLRVVFHSFAFFLALVLIRSVLFRVVVWSCGYVSRGHALMFGAAPGVHFHPVLHAADQAIGL